MILYDGKQNFLGMSSQTLSFLGYEDIADFLSLNSDFANLFIKKEGYVYNFTNFSWIDFVLYSGSANKNAIIKLKNSHEIPIKISIKEIFLTSPLNGENRLYSVKVLSDKFHQITENRDSSSSNSNSFNLNSFNQEAQDLQTKKELDNKAVNTSFSLSSLGITEPKTAVNNIEPKNEKEDETLQLIEEEHKEQTSSKNSFILDFNSIAEQEDENKNLSPNSKQEIEHKTEDGIKSFILDKDEAQENKRLSEEDNNHKLDFLNLEEKEDKLNTKDDNIDQFKLLKTTKDQEDKTEEKTIENSALFNLLKKDKVEERVNDTNIEKKVDSEFKLQKEETKQPEESEFKLDFLKTNLTDSTNQKNQLEQKDDIENNYEIKLQKEKTTQPKESEFKLDFLKTDLTDSADYEKEPDDKKETLASSLKLDDEKIEQKEDNNIIKSANENIIKQIKKDIKEIDIDYENSKDEKTENEDFFLNIVTNDKDKQIKEDQNTDQTLQNLFANKETHQPNETKYNIEQDIELSSLDSLGLDKKDQQELIYDFIFDTNSSIDTIEEFIKTKDFDKINYALVKIKSSAEILNLDAIIENTNMMRRHCMTKDENRVLEDVQLLKKYLVILENKLKTAEAV